MSDKDQLQPGGEQEALATDTELAQEVADEQAAEYGAAQQAEDERDEEKEAEGGD